MNRSLLALIIHVTAMCLAILACLGGAILRLAVAELQFRK